MKTDDYYEQLGEVVELRPEETLSGIAEVKIIKDRDWFRVRISMGDYMYFDSPLVFSVETAKTILDNVKQRLH